MTKEKTHWNAEQTTYRMSSNHDPIWALVYDPTPVGRKRDDGAISYSLRFPALILAEYISDPERVAHEISAKLNVFDDMLEALRAIVIESSGKAIPNESLAACRKRALDVIAKAENGS